jgi:endoglucanase
MGGFPLLKAESLAVLTAVVLVAGCGTTTPKDRQPAPQPKPESSKKSPPPATKAAAVEGVSARVPAEAAMVGVNLASGEFGTTPGVYDKDYAYPGAKQFDYCKAQGLSVVRLPFKWERVQRELMGPLDATEMKRLDGVVALARARGLKLLLDVHNYARYHGKLIGTPDVPNAAFADFWKKVATHYKDEEAIFAYGLMNEPHDTQGLWPAAAQAAIDAVRSVDTKHTISVCGDGWSGAHSWKKINNGLLLKDPANNLIYEAHQYFDRDNSGTYKQSYDDSGAQPNTGTERLQPFVEWLKEHNARGFIGEFAIPDDDERWLAVLDSFLAAMKTHNIGGTYWAAGPWWGKYPLSVEPRDGKDRPQMAVLSLYAGSRTRPPDAKVVFTGVPRAAAPAPSTREQKTLPAGARKVVYDCGAQKESYHYSNDGSEYASTEAQDAGRKARKITYTHQGKVAWLGAGLYFGALDCHGYGAFSLAVRAEKPCKLEVKAYHADNARFAAQFDIGTEWRELLIPFDKLTNGNAAFDSTRPLLKVELQPSPDSKGSSLYLGEFSLVVPQP